MRRLLLAMAVVVATLAIAGTCVSVYSLVRLSRTDAQVCRFIVGRVEERVKQQRDTARYLASPAGQERTLLNAYIRDVARPQALKEIEHDRATLPGNCR